MMDKNTRYTIAELYEMLKADNSLERDPEAREALIFGYEMTVYV